MSRKSKISFGSKEANAKKTFKYLLPIELALLKKEIYQTADNVTSLQKSIKGQKLAVKEAQREGKPLMQRFYSKLVLSNGKMLKLMEQHLDRCCTLWMQWHANMINNTEPSIQYDKSMTIVESANAGIVPFPEIWDSGSVHHKCTDNVGWTASILNKWMKQMPKLNIPDPKAEARVIGALEAVLDAKDFTQKPSTMVNNCDLARRGIGGVRIFAKGSVAEQIAREPITIQEFAHLPALIKLLNKHSVGKESWDKEVLKASADEYFKLFPYTRVFALNSCKGLPLEKEQECFKEMFIDLGDEIFAILKNKYKDK